MAKEDVQSIEILHWIYYVILDHTKLETGTISAVVLAVLLLVAVVVIVTLAVLLWKNHTKHNHCR